VRGLNARKERKSRKLVESGVFACFGNRLTAARKSVPDPAWTSGIMTSCVLCDFFRGIRGEGTF
jgi:hypothetical protein